MTHSRHSAAVAVDTAIDRRAKQAAVAAVGHTSSSPNDEATAPEADDSNCIRSPVTEIETDRTKASVVAAVLRRRRCMLRAEMAEATMADAEPAAGAKAHSMMMMTTQTHRKKASMHKAMAQVAAAS